MLKAISARLPETVAVSTVKKSPVFLGVSDEPAVAKPETARTEAGIFREDLLKVFSKLKKGWQGMSAEEKGQAFVAMVSLGAIDFAFCALGFGIPFNLVMALCTGGALWAERRERLKTAQNPVGPTGSGQESGAEVPG